MKLTFIGCKESQIDIFTDLSKNLKKRISGVEIEKRFAPFPEDLPELARESAEESDFIFVFAIIPEKDKISLVEEKLIDVELETKTRILKAIREDDLSSEEEEFFMEKENLVEEFTQLIIDVLFNEQKFAPKDKDFGL
jgi:riboflavin synthase